jgi:hypothetical protein
VTHTDGAQTLFGMVHISMSDSSEPEAAAASKEDTPAGCASTPPTPDLAESGGLPPSIVASSLNCVSAVALGADVPTEDACGDRESVVCWAPSAVAEPLPKKMYVPVSSSLPSSLTAAPKVVSCEAPPGPSTPSIFFWEHSHSSVLWDIYQVGLYMHARGHAANGVVL